MEQRPSGKLKHRPERVAEVYPDQLPSSEDQQNRGAGLSLPDAQEGPVVVAKGFCGLYRRLQDVIDNQDRHCQKVAAVLRHSKPGAKAGNILKYVCQIFDLLRNSFPFLPGKDPSRTNLSLLQGVAAVQLVRGKGFQSGRGKEQDKPSKQR